jgi:hypothetical protein
MFPVREESANRGDKSERLVEHQMVMRLWDLYER